MRRIDSNLLVCTPEQAQKLIGLGIIPASVFCYEFITGEMPDDAKWEFVGEYMGQSGCIPAWTLEELFVMIGPEYNKPDLVGPDDWTPTKNMMEWTSFTLEKRINNASGAIVAAAFLQCLLKEKYITSDEANKRMDAWITKDHYNPRGEELEKEVKEKRKSKR